jgi:hypothetical protein
MSAIDEAKNEEKPAPKGSKAALPLLKSATVKEAVPFSGPTDQTLICAAGTLELDLANRVIRATPRDPNRDAIEVPLENVKCYVRLTEAHKAKIEATARPAPKPAPRPVVQNKGDTIKFVRGPDGKPMEQLPDGTLRPAVI